MKRIFALLIIVFGCLYCNAQDYVPLVREGVKWKCGLAVHSYWFWSYNYIEPYTIYFEGDTIIENHSYKNCMLVFDGYPDEVSDSTLCGFAREDIANKKVYFRNNLQYNAHYHIVYDFLHESYITGDEVILYDFDDVTQCGALFEEQNLIVETEDVDIAGKLHRQYNIKYSDGSHFLSMIEGIGCIGNHNSPYLENIGDLLRFYVSGYTTGGTDCMPMFFRLEDAEGNIIYDAPNDEHVRLVREGVKWKYTRVFNPETPEAMERVPFTMELKGDTAIHGLRCKNVIWTNEATGEQTVGEHFMLENIIKKTVFEREESGYRCLYAFNEINIGEYCGDVDVSIMRDSTIMLGNVKTVCHKFDYGDGRKYSFIEGVGFVNETPNEYGEYDGNLLCFLQGTDPDASYYDVFMHLEDADGNILYTAPKSPYGFGGIEVVGKLGEDAVEVARYDVHGRRLAKPVPGINIIRMSDGTVRKQLHRE